MSYSMLIHYEFVFCSFCFVDIFHKFSLILLGFHVFSAMILISAKSTGSVDGDGTDVMAGKSKKSRLGDDRLKSTVCLCVCMQMQVAPRVVPAKIDLGKGVSNLITLISVRLVNA